MILTSLFSKALCLIIHFIRRLITFNNKIFVATSNGLYYANKNDNLLDLSVWQNNSRISFSQGDFDTIISLAGIPVLQVGGVDEKKWWKKIIDWYRFRLFTA